MSEEIKNEKKSNKSKLFTSVTVVFVIVLLIAGFTYAWFFRQTDMATLMAITPPSDIAILGPDGKEIDSLDLNYSEDDKQGNKVTVKKVICVQSEEEVKKYNLEIVHTTNLKGLTFKLYPVLEKNEKSAQTVTEDGKTYSYLLGSQEEGEYINLEKNLPSESEYKNADSSKHKSNYDSYGSVQSHAEPLYWLVKNPLTPSNANPTTLNNKIYNRTYYVCEVSWTETTRETDIFYILAQID